MIHDGTRECRVVLATTSWFRLVISYTSLHHPNKEGHANFIISKLLFLQESFCGVYEKLLPNNYSISVSRRVH